MKYIDAEKLIANLERQNVDKKVIKPLIRIITFLQQEQPEVQNGKFVFPKYLYARTKDNKTIDMSYAPQDMTAVEYIRNDFVEQGQPKVDLEKEIRNYNVPFNGWERLTYNTLEEIARHFYELGLKARK